jgi:hypothetical protein
VQPTTNHSKAVRGPLSVSMSFRPVFAYIEGVREFGRFFCATTFQQPELVERARVALQETLENAVTHSRYPWGLLTLEISCDGPELRISTISEASPADIRLLREEIEMLRAFDPEAGYLAAFARAAREPDSAPRLGLARLRYECRFDLEINDEPDGQVRVTAIGKL